MDEFDRRILEIVQENNQLTHAEIGNRTGLSDSAVRRRLGVLRNTGVIERDVAMLNQNETGVRLVVTISFLEESVETYDAFDHQIARTPEIRQAYHVAGAEDYLLIVHGPSLQWYEDWSKQTFMSNPAVRRYDTRVVWSCKKFETALIL